MADPPSIIPVARELGPWILSFVAFAQFWIAKLVDHFRKSTIEIYESRNVQVGYGGLGPSLCLVGTLRGRKKAEFVREMDAVVVRVRDGARSQLLWWATRSGGPSGQANQPVLGFLLDPSHPFNYDTFVVDERFVAAMKGKLSDLSDRWRNFLTERLQVAFPAQPVDLSTVLGNPTASEGMFADFLSRPEPVEIHEELKNRLYWESGAYVLTLNVRCANDRSFSKTWNFSLTEDDSRRLRLNSIATVRDACGLRAFYHSAFPKYEVAG